MSVEPGYKRYACDRSDRTHLDNKRPIVFMKDDDERVKEWLVDAAYTDVNGVERMATLCPECAPTFKKICMSQAKDMQLFMNQ